MECIWENLLGEKLLCLHDTSVAQLDFKRWPNGFQSLHGRYRVDITSIYSILHHVNSLWNKPESALKTLQFCIASGFSFCLFFQVTTHSNLHYPIYLEHRGLHYNGKIITNYLKYSCGCDH